MLCVTINGPSFEEAAQQILSLPLEVDLLEFRLDMFENLDEQLIENLRNIRALPVIFTLREPFQGSTFKGTESERLNTIQRYAKLNPEFIDLENTVSPDFISTITHQHPQTQIILSYHNYKETPVDLDTLYSEMRKTSAHLYKIAVLSTSSIDALRLMLFLKRAPKPVCVMGMGEYGEVTRVLGKICGSAITYSSVTEANKVVQGQLSARTLLDLYHYKDLTEHTFLYGLLGDPVNKSIGHKTHNAFFKLEKIPAVYLKMKVSIPELKEIIPLTKQLGFRGLSITMPLKEELLNCADTIDPYVLTIGAANTFVNRDNIFHAFNTDGVGALNAIEKLQTVKGKKVLIIGAGGAAKAIIVEAVARGGIVTVLNRTLERAQELKKELPIEIDSLKNIEKVIGNGYDILINCTPDEMPFDPKLLLPNTVVMDIKTIPQLTTLLKEALALDCQVVYGYQMFLEQALEQYALWFPNQFSRTHAREILEKQVKLALENFTPA